MPASFERGVVIVSIDTEQMWGYRDLLSEAQFESRFPDAPAAHVRLLARLCEAGVSATWFVVGGLALRDDALPSLWRCRSFLERLRDACPAQEIGLHGGLTHLIWTGAGSTLETARRELTDGILALTSLCGTPSSFSFPRNQEAYYHLLPEFGLRCFRGRPQALAWRLGPKLPGAILRASEELLRRVPPPVWPAQTIPALWNIPASMFFYPITPARSRIIGLRSRIERFRRGMEAAARCRAVFHFCLHPENLVESRSGFSVLEEILEKLVHARDRGDIEVMTMTGVADRMERKELYDCQGHS
jgi:hypothetical protein